MLVVLGYIIFVINSGLRPLLKSLFMGIVDLTLPPPPNPHFTIMWCDSRTNISFVNQIQKNSSEKIPSFMVQTNMFFLLSKRNLKRNLLKHKWNWSRIILNYYRFNVCIFILKLISLKTPGSYWKYLLKQEHRKWRLVRKFIFNFSYKD